MTTSNQLAIGSNENNNDPDSYKPVNFSDALYLATRGSARVTSLDDDVGALETGLKLDCLRVRLSSRKNPVTALFGHESVRDMVHKFVFVGDDRNVAQVWVGGREVKNIVD